VVSYGEGRSLTPCTALAAVRRSGAPQALVQALLRFTGPVRARGKKPLQRSAAASREATKHLTSGDSADARAVNGAECYDATPAGDDERVFVTVQRGRADFAL